MGFSVIKRRKKLCIVNDVTGEVVYTPPDFVYKHIRNRDGMKKLAKHFDQHWPKVITYIMDFEEETRNGR